MGKEDRQYFYSEEQGEALITYSAGVSAEGNPQESMINVGIVRGGVVFPAVEAIYNKDGKLDAYLVHNNSDHLEWKNPREHVLRDMDGRFMVTVAPFDSISLPMQVAGLPGTLDKGNVTKAKMESFPVGVIPHVVREPSNVSSLGNRTKEPQEHLSATGDE